MANSSNGAARDSQAPLVLVSNRGPVTSTSTGRSRAAAAGS